MFLKSRRTRAEARPLLTRLVTLRRSSPPSALKLLSLIESRTRGGAPWHVHSREDEYFYVIEGKIIVHCGDEIYSAGPGSFVFLPRGIPHAWNVGAEGVATLLMMTVPAMLEEFLQEFHRASTREDRDAVAAGYGIQFFWERS